MIYEYKCNVCDKTFGVDLDPKSQLPKLVPCVDKECSGMMSRIWSINAIVPEHMKSTSDNSINYEKSSQIHKKHFGAAGRY